MDSQATDLSRLKIVRKDIGPASSPHPWPRKIVWTVIVVCILVAVGVAIRFLAPFAQTVEVIAVSLASPSQALTLLNASGYVVAQRRAAVASKGTGRLVELRVREGDRVKKGQILARLESADMAAALSRTQANLNVARSAYDQAKAELKDATFSYERKKNLLESGLVPQAEFDAVEARYDRAQAAIASAEASIRASEAAVRGAQVDIDNTYIRAPFDGTVLAKNAEVGEVVAPFGSSAFAKAAVVTIADMTSLQVEADVSESNIEKIYLGQRCEISLDAYPEIRHEGIVDTIVPTADRAKATVLTKIRFLKIDDRVLPEMSAKVAFLSKVASDVSTQPVVAVHPSAVVLREERKVAFLVQGDRVVEMPVEVGGPVGHLIEVKKGLHPGDQVVMNPSTGLTAGDRIRIRSKD